MLNLGMSRKQMCVLRAGRHQSLGFAGSMVVLAAGVLAGCATTPPSAPAAAAKAHEAADYYPLDAGWKWAYDLERAGDKMLAVYAVLERTMDTAIIQAGDERLEYAVSPQGVAQKDGVTIGDYILKNPIALGAEWSVFSGKAKITSVDQTLHGPSGDYTNCIVVEALRTDPVRLSRTTYAPGVGPVAIEIQVQSQGRFVTTMRASLRGATRPGQDPLAVAP